MKEQEIRDRLQAFIDGFDRATAAVRSGVRKVVLPATLGLGLAIAPGCGVDDSDRTVPVSDSGGNELEAGAMLYAAPFPGPDAGVLPPQPEYAAPFPTPEADAGPAEDAGQNVALYAAPFPADALTPDPDGGAKALYAAPFPDPDAAA